MNPACRDTDLGLQVTSVEDVSAFSEVKGDGLYMNNNTYSTSEKERKKTETVREPMKGSAQVRAGSEIQSVG